MYNRSELSDLNLYIYALSLKEQDKIAPAIEAFMKTLDQNPFLWSAWVEVCSLICTKDDKEAVRKIKLYFNS